MDNNNQPKLAMGQFAIFFCLLALVAQSNAQNQATVTDNWIRGYVQFDLAPPHNEIDAGLCLGAPQSQAPANAACSAFARYMASGHLEVRPFQKLPVPILKTIYVFGNPSFLFGNNLPQEKYTWSAQPIGWERSWGAVLPLPKGFEFRVTDHFLFGTFRTYSGNAAYIGPNGPWGRYNSVGVRKYFGYHSGSPE
jgi:hypothetical protein